MTIGSIDFPPDSGDAVDYLPFSAGSRAPTFISLTQATGAGSQGVPAGALALPARLRQYSVYANPGIINAVGTSVVVFGTTQVFDATQPDSMYWDLLDGGGAGASAGVTGEQMIALRYQPIHWELQIRSSPLANGEWRLWAGMIASVVGGAGGIINNDALGLIEGIAFRFHKTVQPLIVVVVNDGTVQTEVITTVPYTEGPGAQNTYRFSLDIDATTITWTVQNLTSGVQQTGTIAIPAAFSKTVMLRPTCSLTDIPGGAKEFFFGKSEWSHR